MNNRKFIPCGEFLRSLLSHNEISKSDVNHVLRDRGVFCASKEKCDTAPILVKTILSPFEANSLRDNVKVRENTSKANMRSLEWNSDTTLIDAVSGIITADTLIKDTFVNYEISIFSDFHITTDDDAVALEFEIERKDGLEGWDRNTRYFKGKIELEKADKESDQILVNISLNHTSSETKLIANIILDQLKSHLKSKGHVKPEAKLYRVLFSDFTNENRIRFLKKIASDYTENEFYFKDILDFQFKPDDSTPFSEDVNWLEKNIDELKLKGKLTNTVFFRKKSIHKNLKVFRIVAGYSINIEHYSGTCKVSYEFPDFSVKGNENAELLIDFSYFKIKGASQSYQLKVKTAILKKIEKIKAAVYQDLKSIDEN